MLYYIYAIVDPQSGEPGYVGLSTQPEIRLRQHLTGDTNHEKTKWLKQLSERGISPEIRILEEGEDLETAKEREKHWIRTYHSQYPGLTNHRHVPQATPTKDACIPLQNKASYWAWSVPPYPHKRDYGDAYYEWELVNHPDYINDQFDEFIFNMEHMDGHSFTKDEKFCALELFMLCTYKRSSQEGEKYRQWYKQQFQPGGPFEGEKSTLNID